MDKQVFQLESPQIRENAVLAILRAEEGARVTIGPKGRTLPQNAFSHAWYEEIAHAFPEDDELGWKCYCKLHHGVPILRAEDEEFRDAYDATIKGLSYEQKLQVMRVLPVTSRMNVKQLTKYADAVRDDFSKRGLSLEVKEAAHVE